MGSPPSGLEAKAKRLISLHRRGEPLRLLNAWDAGSARLFERRGAQAIGTTSAGVAFALGRPDGAITRDEMLYATARIAGAVDVPVTADVESGFGAAPADVGETIRLVIAAGRGGRQPRGRRSFAGDEPLIALGEQVQRIEAARAAAERAAVPLFINARTDVFWLGLGDGGRAARPRRRAAVGLRRGRR